MTLIKKKKFPRLNIEMNGRINLDFTTGFTDQGITNQFTSPTKLGNDVGRDLVKGTIEKNLLNQTYFSDANVQIIQNRLIYEVYQKSNGKYRIGPQSAENLLIIMRSMYFQYGKNLDYAIKEQITELNNYVIAFAVPKILSEADMYETYRKDITTLPVPMSRSVNLSQAGTKSRPLNPFF
jgi:hypothetical protein